MAILRDLQAGSPGESKILEARVRGKAPPSPLTHTHTHACTHTYIHTHLVVLVLRAPLLTRAWCYCHQVISSTEDVPSRCYNLWFAAFVPSNSSVESMEGMDGSM